MAIEIPQKIRVFINASAIVRDPNHRENPLEFLYKRFVGEMEKSKLTGIKAKLVFKIRLTKMNAGPFAYKQVKTRNKL